MTDGNGGKKVEGRVRNIIKRARQMDIALSKLDGLMPSEIAEALEVPISEVYKVLGRPSTKKLIEVVREDFYRDGLPRAAENMSKALAGRLKGGAEVDRQFKASERLLEGAGVLNSKAPSIYVEQVFNDNRMFLSPLVEGIIKSHLKEVYNVVDGEVVKDDNKGLPQVTQEAHADNV